MNLIRPASLFTFFCFLSIFSAFAQSIPLKTRIDSLIKLNVPRKFNGVIAIAQSGKIIYSQNYGYSDFAQKTSFTEESQFILGSLSKQFTAVLVLQELDKGHLSLKDPIRKYLPDLKESWADSVTVHHLLNHTSGIVALDKPLSFKPGTKFSYSPLLCYQLLAQIAEKLSGKTYQELMKTLFEKCDMTNSTIPVAYKSGKLVSCYSEENDGILALEKVNPEELGFATPGGGIISTKNDLIKWNEALHHGKLLKTNTYKLMTTASSSREHARWGNIDYGYGLQIDKQDDILELSHSGALIGFISSNLYFPETETSIVILENIAWNFDNVIRTFFFHDQIRKIVKENLKR